jgi:hypothetical protein
MLAGYVFGSSRSADINAGSTEAVAAAAYVEPEPLPEQPPEHTIEIIKPPAPAGSIAIPGFDRLTVQGRTLQAGVISNPVQNACYFIVTILLEDGTEIYRSGILAPGQSVGAVELAKTLEPGTYEGVVARYQTYALENLQPLNGADVEFILEVSP